MNVPNDRLLREARDQFEFLLRKDAHESQWQSFFAEHPYVLSLSLPLRLRPDDIVPLGRPGKAEPDFIFYPHRHSPAPYYGVIEIKRPKSRIVTVSRSNIAVLSRDAATAVRQAQSYSALVKTSFIKCTDELLCLGNESHLFIIMGMTAELSLKLGNKTLFETVQDNLPRNLQILPYDELLRRFKSELPPKIFVLYPEALYQERRRRIFAFADDLRGRTTDVKPETVLHEMGRIAEAIYKTFELSAERGEAIAVLLPRPNSPEIVACVADVGFGYSAQHMQYKLGNVGGLTDGVINRREYDYCVDHLSAGSRSTRGNQALKKCEKVRTPVSGHSLSFVGVPLGNGNADYNKGALVFNISTPLDLTNGDQIDRDYVEPLTKISEALNPIIEGPWKQFSRSQTGA